MFTITVVSLFLSCNKWDEPEYNMPVFELPEGSYLRTISYIKELHTLGTIPALIQTPPRGDIYISGYVVSSDEGGNFFKSLVVQDATGGIEIRVDKTGLYNEYPVGQKVFVKCSGLYIGDYGKYPQLGVLYNVTQVGRINTLLLSNQIFKDSLPDIKRMYQYLGAGYEKGQPVKITSDADMAAHIGQLVMIPDCHFDAAVAGEPLAYNDIDFTNRTVYFGNTSIFLRTSSYAKFKNIICQDKPFTLYGVISVYNSDYQFTLRTGADIDFQNGGAMQTVQEFIFDASSFNVGNWRVSHPESSSKWMYVDFDNNKFMCHLLKSDDVCDDWLISPLINFTNYNDISLVLNHTLLLSGSLQDYYQVYYSTTDNGSDFNEADWHPLSMLTSFPTSYAESNLLTLSGVGNSPFRIAIRAHKYAAPVINRWDIKSIKIVR
jgi:hypothetical protein